ncbi:MAG TPA: ATP-dependent helicase, partial [Streptosporangiaceae bacterium]|nr:ATP-dependent helicase [Streptosporangiaceae bacterium]
MDAHAPAYRLLRTPLRAAEAPVLDASQQAVVDHVGGPLLVLAGPGTGKTTTIVETVADRVLRRGTSPERVLVLTFSRKAAAELRERITARLCRTTRQPLAMTFHSYAWALLRREFVLAGEDPPTLLPGPEQLLEVRRLLRGEAEDGGVRWPQRMRPALVTAGFAAELRDFVLRAAERGLDGGGLAELGHEYGREEWVAAGAFMRRYAARFDLAPVPAYDYAEVIRIAAALLARNGAGARERQAYDLVCVDEYQDTDPAQEELLHTLAGGGADLVVVGDPDQSIYAFRGADSGALGRFPDRFRAADGRPADVLALRVCRRSGPVLLAASRRVAARLPAPPASPSAKTTYKTPLSPEVAASAQPGGSWPARRVGGHRDLLPASTPSPGEVRVIMAGSVNEEAAAVADVLRQAHLRDGVPWASMAVLVRSVVHHVSPLRRALTSAGVPVSVAGDELPLEAEPGVRPLLLLMRCALFPATLDEEAATELLCGPLGGTDALGLRRLRRSLGAQGVVADAGPLATALADPRELVLLDGAAADAARKVAELLAAARRTAASGSAHDMLWAVWDASGLGPAWQATSAGGGPRGAAADRDLDAVCALFDAAARFTERLPPGSPRLFLDSLRGQEIPGDTLARQAPDSDAVSILTAHRSKGLEWDVVVVAGVQEGVWPDLRTRSSLLGMDDMVDAAAGLAAPGSGADATAAALAAKLL